MVNIPTFNPWITCPKPNPKAELRLFCFPYAGGGTLGFRSWSDILIKNVEVCPIQLPGRENRLTEQPFTKFKPLLQALVQSLLPYLEKPFAFFGHSMGGLISFELARLLRKDYGLRLTHLFISGCCAPQIPVQEPSIHNLPEREFLEKLRCLNGTPETVLKNTELMQLLLPTLRADFALLEGYVYTPKPLLDSPITALGGLQDEEVSYGDLEAWNEQTSDTFLIHMFPGDHFFLNSVQPLLLQFLNRKFAQILREDL